ncbi:hypothetical protein [Clostridium butyricum]|nr:hypothetical protein [Clostridium butyricum]
MKEFIALVLEVILLILKMNISPEEATRTTAEKYNVSYQKLWNKIPKRWK